MAAVSALDGRICRTDRKNNNHRADIEYTVHVFHSLDEIWALVRNSKDYIFRRFQCLKNDIQFGTSQPFYEIN